MARQANYHITVLPGDGISPEVVAEAVKALRRVAEVYDHTFEFAEALVGGAAIEATGEPLPAEKKNLVLSRIVGIP